MANLMTSETIDGNGDVENGKAVGAAAAAEEAVIVWKSLHVTVKNVKGDTQHILQDVTGYLQPKGLLAIMGPSGSGKTTLLDTLAGRLSRKVQRTGEILLNGHQSRLSYGVSAYVTQEETLTGTLTVREHLRFVAMLRLCGRMPHQAQMERVEEVMTEMGLAGCADTTIGNWHLKGISGGQKRRLAIASELITHPTLLFLDEPTSGLDAAAAFHVTTVVRSLAKRGRTIIASLHQPSSEVFELFDTLCLLAGGRAVYFGALVEADDHYMAAGLPCPAHRNPADHYLHCINSDFAEAEAGVDMEANVDALVRVYTTERMPAVQQQVAVLSQPGEPYEGNRSGSAWFTQTAVLTRRMVLNFWRNLGVFWLRLGMYAMLTLCLGTVYLHLGTSWTDQTSKITMMFFIVAFLTFMAISGFPAFEEDMQVFISERLNGYYGVASFVAANTAAGAPFILGIAIISTLVFYWLAGLNSAADRVVYYILDLFLSLMCVESLMMAMSAVVPHYLMGIAGGAGLLGVFMLVGGFLKPVADLPKAVWRYPLHYLAYHSYAFHGFMRNEYDGTGGWACPCTITPGGCAVTPCTVSGEEVLRLWTVNTVRSKWVDLAIMTGMIAVYRVAFFAACKAAEWMKTA